MEGKEIIQINKLIIMEKEIGESRLSQFNFFLSNFNSRAGQAVPRLLLFEFYKPHFIQILVNILSLLCGQVREVFTTTKPC